MLPRTFSCSCWENTMCKYYLWGVSFGTAEAASPEQLCGLQAGWNSAARRREILRWSLQILTEDSKARRPEQLVHCPLKQLWGHLEPGEEAAGASCCSNSRNAAGHRTADSLLKEWSCLRRSTGASDAPRAQQTLPPLDLSRFCCSTALINCSRSPAEGRGQTCNPGIKRPALISWPRPLPRDRKIKGSWCCHLLVGRGTA